jgi:hypothetical protein
MELPSDVLIIIKDFSRPMTRPDWRRVHRMTHANFYKDIQANSYMTMITDDSSVLLFKNMILFFENEVFFVFRFQDFLNIYY